MSHSINFIKASVAGRNPRVWTHVNGDLDAYFSVCAYARAIGAKVSDLALEFKPAGIPKIPAGVLALDMGAGFKGLETSCFEELVNLVLTEPDRRALGNLAKHVTLQDRGKLFMLPPSVSVGTLGAQVSVLRATGKADWEILGWLEPVFEASLSSVQPESERAQVLDTLLKDWVQEHFKLVGSLEPGSPGSQFERWVAKIQAPDDREALRDIAEHVTLQITGELAQQPEEIRVGLIGPTLVRLKAALGWNRKEVVAWMTPLFAGHLERGRQKIVAAKALARCPRYKDGRILLLTEQGATTTAAFEAGADFAIYIDGLNVGIVRNAKISEPNLKTLFEGVLPKGFYLDERGFMASWGNRKNPATTKCPMTPFALAELLASKL